MGKKDHHKRSREGDSSDDDKQHHKHKQDKYDKHKKKKSKHKKHKRRSHSSDSSGSSSGGGSEDARLAAAKAYLQQHLANNPPGASSAAAAAAAGAGARPSAPPRSSANNKPEGAPDLTDDDYFARSGEFTSWLLEDQHKFFNELSSEEARALFSRFAAAWNGGQLPPRYYQGLVTAPMKRTSHQWALKGAEKKKRLGMTAFMDEEQERRTEQRAAERATDAASRKAWRREQREALDELLPKATGGTHEAKVEQRMARREAARAREDSPDRAWVTGGGDVMGGDDSFAAAKAREAKRAEWRNHKASAQREELAARTAAAAAAEEAKMAGFRQLVAAAGTITIPKRAPQ